MARDRRFSSGPMLPACGWVKRFRRSRTGQHENHPESLVVIETNIDDMNPELYEPVQRHSV